MMQDKDAEKDKDDGNVKKDEDDKKPGEWTKEEMDEAEPAPMPEVDDDDD